MIGYADRAKVTADNIDRVKEQMSGSDQKDDLEIGCETWGIIYQPGNQRGQMTIWPNGRGAVCTGADSAWGDWYEDRQMLLLDGGDGIWVDVDGNEHTN